MEFLVTARTNEEALITAKMMIDMPLSELDIDYLMGIVARMKDVTPSFEACDPIYIVVATHIENETCVVARCDRRVFVCDVCHKEQMDMRYLSYPLRFLSVFRGPCFYITVCSDECKERATTCYAQHVQARREMLQATIVEDALGYLRMRQAVPDELWCYLSDEEHAIVGRRLSDEFIVLRREVLWVLMHRVSQLGHVGSPVEYTAKAQYTANVAYQQMTLL